MSSFAFAFSRSPYPLTRALVRAQEPRERIVSGPDNDWAASRLLVALLMRATPRREWLGRDRARAILADAGSSVPLEELEKKHWVRFVVGHLEIPDWIRGELRWRKHPEAVSDREREALQLLLAARNDDSPLFWLERSEVERIHSAHGNALPLTPDLPALEKAEAIRSTVHNGHAGYVLPWGRLLNGWLSPWLCTRVLGLYWEELTRGLPSRPNESADDCLLQLWLSRAREFPCWGLPTEHMTTTARERLVRCAARRILQEEDVEGPSEEVERFLMETVGFDRSPTFRVPAPPENNGSLLEAERWFRHAYLHEGSGLRPIRKWLDVLIGMVVENEDDAWHHRVIEMLRASRNKPYVVYYAAMCIGWSGGAIAGLVAHVETASLGMRLLARRTIHVEADFHWEEPSDRTRLQEFEKNRLWREAVGILLGTIHEEYGHEPAECTLALGETLLLSVPGTAQPTHLPRVDDVLREGAEERFRILCHALSSTRHSLLYKLAGELQRFLVERVEKHSWARPASEICIWLWLLRTLMADPEGTALDPNTIANSLLSAYEGVFLRASVDGNGNPRTWYDDAPEIVAQPWADLALFLHRQGRVGELLEPRGIGIIDQLSKYYRADQYGGGDEHRRWLRKSRLHLRVLFAIHDSLTRRDIDPASGPTEKQAAELLSLVEEQASQLVSTCTRSAHDGKHASLFAPDKEPGQGGIAGPEGILHRIVRGFNRFTSSERRNKAFASWIDVEDDPAALLLILENGLPVGAKAEANRKLKTLDITRVRWSPEHLQQMAVAANVAGQRELVLRILNHAPSYLNPSYLKKEWALFAYEMRLMLAYHDGIEAELPLPPNHDQARPVDKRVQSPALDKREFYRGLIKLKADDPAGARTIFGDLLDKYPGSVSHAVNFAAASLERAKRVDPDVEDSQERRLAFLRVLHEWENLERTIPASALAGVRRNVACLQLMAMDGARRDDSFDVTWASLGPEMRADIEVVSIGVANAKRRGLKERVKEMLEHAQPYHVDAQGKVDERFESIKSDMVAPDTGPYTATVMAGRPGDELQSEHYLYMRLLNSRAPRAVQVVRGPGTKLHAYLMAELHEVAKEVMRRQKLFDLGKETRRNDLMVSLLHMRVCFLKWSVAEGRGGSSTKGIEPGERDWVLTNPSSGGEIAIFEALELKRVDRNSLDEHVDKVVFKYDPCGLEQAYIIVYYSGKAPFQKFWEEEYVPYVQEKELRGVKPAGPHKPYPDEPLRDIAVIRLDYMRDGMEHFVYHMALNVGSEPSAGNNPAGRKSTAKKRSSGGSRTGRRSSSS